MSYRPICDTWLLARPKVKLYGAYPNGFLERARPLLGVTPREALVHVCGGKAREYPNKMRGFCRRDVTVDADPTTRPDWLLDVSRHELPANSSGWPALLADPPYTPEDAAHYPANCHGFMDANLPPVAVPQPNDLLRKMLRVVRPGGRVGLLHYLLPQPPRVGAHFVACVGVVVGFNNRMRCFSVFERAAED